MGRLGNPLEYSEEKIVLKDIEDGELAMWSDSLR